MEPITELCKSGRHLLTPENVHWKKHPKTGKPSWECLPCRREATALRVSRFRQKRREKADEKS